MVNEIMCMYGYIPNKQSRPQIAEKVNSFRGPDKSSSFSLVANFKNIEFGHSRLTITGNEKMASASCKQQLCDDLQW